MPLNKPLVQTLAALKLETAKQELVLANYPDATIHYYNGFQSKSVNKTYTAYDFDRCSYSISFMPFSTLELDYEGTKHTIRISSSPKKSRACYLGYDYTSHKNIIRFSRVAINMKTHQFSANGDIIQDLKVEIVKFIQQHPGMAINDKHLDPRLKKLIAFV